MNNITKEYWDRLNASVPSYRDNQPRLTAWDLFHDFGYSNLPLNTTAAAAVSHPNFPQSESTTRHSLTSPVVPLVTPEDGFPPSYALFQHMSPNFSNEYHPVVAQHIRTWGELETRIADEPRYSPEFESLLRQYYTARYKAKRMTELDRQSRGGSLSVQARDEYFQLLNTPGPFDMPISSGSGNGNSGHGRNESSSSGGGNGGAGVGGVGGGGGGSSTGHSLHLHLQPQLQPQPHQPHQPHQHHQPHYQQQYQPQPHHQHPNLGQIGISFGRAATFGSFLQSASAAQTASHSSPHTIGTPRSQGITMSHQPPSSSTSAATGEHRPALGSGIFTNAAVRSTSATSQVSPHRSSHRRRGSTPADSMPTTRLNSQPDNASRPAPVIDRERERDRDRETGRITAGTSPYADAATTASNQVDRHPTLGPPTPRHSSTTPAIGTSSAAAASSSPSSSASPAQSIPPSLPPPPYPAFSDEIPEISDYHHSHFFNPAPNPTVTSFVRSRRIRPNRERRRRRISSVTPDIEIERSAADRRRQLRERNESEWESQRPLSISSPGGTNNTNRASVDSTVVDAVMSDLPSSQNSDTSNRTSNSASEPGRASETEPPAHNSLRHRPYFNIPPTSEPWNTSLLPGESSRNQLNESSVITPYRRDGSSNPSTSTPQNTMSGSPITSIAPFVVSANRRTLRPTLLDQTTSPPVQSPPESSTTRNGLTSPANRLPPSFLPSLPHLPAPRFSPPRTLSRPRGGSISNNSNANNNANHNRQNSNGSDGLFPARRRERVNPLTQPMTARTDGEREDYEIPTRNMITEHIEHQRQAEITRRRFRELEAEQRELLRSPPMPGNDGDSMRRLQEHRQQRNYELLQRTNLQRQMQQNQTDLPSSRSHPGGPQGWYTSWPGPSQSTPNGNNAHVRSPDHASALSFSVVAEDEPSSASEADYEDLIPLENALGEDEQLFATLVDGYLSRVPHESVNRRRARLRGQLGLSPDDVGHLPGSQSSNRAPENDMRERFPSRVDRARRMRDRDVETRYRHSETIRDIANLVTGARENMGFPHRWNRESGSGSNSNGRNTNNNSSQTTRSLDNPERPENMKEEDLKIMADCKVCYGQIADMVLLPCNHLVLCQWCAETVAPAVPNRPEGMVAPRSNCPVCRARVERKIKVFRC
ncbi:hypothetical protein TWF506_002654 [Arthrobotrys conoides]|uniref:RING-type domain-containing protein n=1 Tax=Arthrobotrys conoides TaxID=74498 RepID=A0AAN8RT57_9PEZI